MFGAASLFWLLEKLSFSALGALRRNFYLVWPKDLKLMPLHISIREKNPKNSKTHKVHHNTFLTNFNFVKDIFSKTNFQRILPKKKHCFWAKYFTFRFFLSRYNYSWPFNWYLESFLFLVHYIHFHLISDCLSYLFSAYNFTSASNVSLIFV